MFLSPGEAVIGLVLHFFFTIDVVYADSTNNVNNSTVLQQSETEQTVNKVGARKTMNSGVSVQVVATADDLQSAVQRLPAFNRWKEAREFLQPYSNVECSG